MPTDTLGRRLQWGPRTPRVERFTFTDADHAVFEAINRHGPLPSYYLYEFTKHLRRDGTHLKNRLTEFYHGSRSQGHFLDRPSQQSAQFNAHARHVVYDVAPNARLLLANGGSIATYAPRRADPFVHQLMGACVAASIELCAGRIGLRYISRKAILTRSTCPITTRSAANPMAIPVAGVANHTLIPDDLFGIEYPGHGFRFFAVEVDRNTESIERKSSEQTAFGKKIMGYLDILHRQTHRSWWGLPNLSVLTVTTNARHAQNLLGFVRRQREAPYLARFGFAVEADFGANWRVPNALLSNLMEERWATTTGLKNISEP